jgi:ABC-type nitrate/sulfonate/bicarbonate transport system substrate-binding protein
MKTRSALIAVGVLLLLVAALIWRIPRHETGRTLTVAIAPYQDIAMLVNFDPLELNKKYGMTVRLNTMAWEDILPAVASQGQSVDVGFGSLVEYLTKYKKLQATDDPILFVQPLYVYKGGGFIAFNKNIKPLSKPDLSGTSRLQELLRLRIGAQKQSIYEMMLFSLARRAGMDSSSLKLIDTPMNEGLLATERGSLDITAAGLTQVNEARKRGGQLVITMEDSGFADVTGFIMRRSVLTARRADIEALVRAWFDCVKFVLSDVKTNSQHSLDYLKRSAATRYTLDEYAAALDQEYLPVSLEQAGKDLYTTGGRFDFGRISTDIGDYLLSTHVADARPPVPTILVLPK